MSERNRNRTDRPESGEAETIAIAALAFIADDSQLLGRFVGVTGIEPQAIRRAAREPGFLAGVLQFVLAHEPTLLAFCDRNGIAAEKVAAAERTLSPGRPAEPST